MKRVAALCLALAATPVPAQDMSPTFYDAITWLQDNDFLTRDGDQFEARLYGRETLDFVGDVFFLSEDTINNCTITRRVFGVGTFLQHDTDCDARLDRLHFVQERGSGADLQPKESDHGHYARDVREIIAIAEGLRRVQDTAPEDGPDASAEESAGLLVRLTDALEGTPPRIVNGEEIPNSRIATFGVADKAQASFFVIAPPGEPPRDCRVNWRWFDQLYLAIDEECSGTFPVFGRATLGDAQFTAAEKEPDTGPKIATILRTMVSLNETTGP